MAPRIAKMVAEEIDAFSVAENEAEGHRNHLGASLIGHPCSRYLWYSFRWVKREPFDGRMLRLFNRGHREEPEMIRRLRGIGFEVWEHDEQGKQFRISACYGHFGGSLDGIAKFPARYGITEPVLLEFKTQGTGAGFNELVNKGMTLTKPRHYAQTSAYATKYGFNYCLYQVANKNDDSLHIEMTKLNHNLGNQMIMKAEDIISSQLPKNKLSADPSHFECKYCAMHEICHFDASYEKNCRSCKNAMPVHNAQWECQLWQGIIPSDTIKVGCDRWEPNK